MQKRLWKLLAAAHDFQLCVNKNELFKWEEMRKRHEDSGYGDRFCSKIYSRINADNIENSSAASACANTPEQLFKKMWKTVVPVSYTHLDVYKRQPLYSSASIE